jgi:general stress protein CsbA
MLDQKTGARRRSIFMLLVPCYLALLLGAVTWRCYLALLPGAVTHLALISA